MGDFAEMHLPNLILVVDDDALELDSIAAMVEDLGFRVVTASSSEDAFTEILVQPPSLILTDLYLPDGDGLIAKACAAGYTMPIVAMSDAGRDEALPDAGGMALRLEVAATIDKPFQDTDLLDTLRRALLGRPAG